MTSEQFKAGFILCSETNCRQHVHFFIFFWSQTGKRRHIFNWIRLIFNVSFSSLLPQTFDEVDSQFKIELPGPPTILKSPGRTPQSSLSHLREKNVCPSFGSVRWITSLYSLSYSIARNIWELWIRDNYEI